MMDWTASRTRFDFIGQALDGRGGFRPTAGQGSHLIRHPREGDDKFSSRNQRAVYENHLRSACDRFASFLGRRKPARGGIDAPLVKAMLSNADMLGNDLDSFWRHFAQQAVARGSMLLVIDRLGVDEALTFEDQRRLRALPYIRPAYPEDVASYRLHPMTGAFERITLAGMEWIDDKLQEVERDYDTAAWRLRVRDTQDRANGGWRVVGEGEHGFGACPVLAFTEDGSLFPCIGRFEQIADLSRDLFNLESEQREILASQTFSVLTLKVPFENQAQFDPKATVAMVSTQSMLIYGDERPGFIAPDSGPAEVYQAKIASVREQIARVAMDEAVGSSTQAESGLSRRLRFEALNASLNRFSLNLQALELRMWALFHQALGTQSRVTVSWPSDYALADVAGELDILALMQSTGMPPAALNEKRRAILAVEFDNVDDTTKAALDAALNESAQAGA